MAIIKETVKLYIIQAYGARNYYTFDLSIDYPESYSLLGNVDVEVEYDEADLIDPNAAALTSAEAALEKHRADSHVKEQQLIDRIESLRALPNLEGGQ